MWPSLTFQHKKLKKLEVIVESNLTFNTGHMQRKADIVNGSSMTMYTYKGLTTTTLFHSTQVKGRGSIASEEEEDTPGKYSMMVL